MKIELSGEFIILKNNKDKINKEENEIQEIKKWTNSKKIGKEKSKKNFGFFWVFWVFFGFFMFIFKYLSLVTNIK